MKLYSYFRSSAAFRVRIALALKGLPYDYVAVHLAKGEQRGDAHRAKAPDGLVPVLEDGDVGFVQSMAIMEYLDETYPEPPLLPSDPVGRAQVRALAQAIACEIHPLNNLRVLQYLKGPLSVSEEAKNTWYHHWVRQGLESFERQLQALDVHRSARGLEASNLCFGNTPTLADCLLVPQIFNARRFNVPIDDLQRTLAAFNAAMLLEAFQAAQPERCPDFEA